MAALMLFRLLVLLAIAGILITFALSNWSPLLPLTFLGIQTPALPLALWVLGAIAAGIVTHLVISALFSLASYGAARSARAEFRRATRSDTFQSRSTSPNPEPARSSRREDDSAWRDWSDYETTAPPKSEPVKSEDPIDDWETSSDDDWDAYERPVERPERQRPSVERQPERQPERQSEPQDAPRDRTSASDRPTDRTSERSMPRDYEATQEPKTSSRSGSTYSYGYREPGNTGVGKTESVVDADYRVIVPPYQPLDDTPEENVDDWFDDEDEGRSR